jgi:hypothetical protein
MPHPFAVRGVMPATDGAASAEPEVTTTRTAAARIGRIAVRIMFVLLGGSRSVRRSGDGIARCVPNRPAMT